jgi:hypothetical protein
MDGDGSFTAEIKRFADTTVAQMNKIVAGSILEAADRIKVRSPVDTGFFVNSWMVNADNPSDAPATGNAVIALPPDLLGRTFYLQNTTAYGMRLEYGFVGTDSLGRQYNQAPRGFVRRTVEEWDSIVAEQAQKVAR